MHVHKVRIVSGSMSTKPSAIGIQPILEGKSLCALCKIPAKLFAIVKDRVVKKRSAIINPRAVEQFVTCLNWWNRIRLCVVHIYFY